jgi:3-oxoacyl-[acyl-carrier-protein] synthase-3
METIRIIGTGSYLPPKILTNFDLGEMGLDTTDEWITQRTGISERRIAEPDVATSDLAYEASIQALNTAGMTAKDIDLIILATITPDTCCPSGANWLQARLGEPNAVTFDITAACSGFIFALNVAEQYLKNKTAKNVLVVASEVMSRTVNWKDRSSCILWGDGAGAVLLTLANKGHEILSTHIHTDGSLGQNLIVPGGGSKTTPISHESVDKELHYLKMIVANLSFKVAVKCFIESIKEAAGHNNVKITDINWIIPHQANIRMFKFISKSLNIPFEKFYMTIKHYGNISSASCAIALDKAVRDKSIRKNHLICMPVFGGGLTWGSALIKW